MTFSLRRIINNSWTQRSWFLLHFSWHQITQVPPWRRGSWKTASHKSGFLKHFYECLNEREELVPSFLATGNELFVLKGFPKLRRKGVFRKWARDKKLLTKNRRVKQPHPAIHLTGLNCSWPYSSNSTHQKVGCVCMWPFSPSTAIPHKRHCSIKK